MKEFTAGPVNPPNECGICQAEIHHLRVENGEEKMWGSRIEVYGYGPVDAKAMRDYVLTCLDQHLDELEIEVINNFITLGIAYANDAVASGMRSWHPYHAEKMRDLAGPQAKIATEAMKKLKETTS